MTQWKSNISKKNASHIVEKLRSSCWNEFIPTEKRSLQPIC